MEKELGIIESTYLGIEDHGIFTFFITIDYGGAKQAFGGCTLNEDGLLRRVLEAVGVTSWEKLVGRSVYATHNSIKIVEIEAPQFVPHKGPFNIDEYFNEKRK